MNKIRKLADDRHPEILVVTPLLPNHQVSKLTKKTIKRNKVPFFWLTSEGNYNIPTNAQAGIDWYKKNIGKLPPYYIMIDRDIEMGRNMLDRLYNRLNEFSYSSGTSKIGYCYATFQFQGHVNANFPARPFDINRLVRSNYISSNSMFLTEVIEEVGLVTDDKYKRLLDYAFLLKCFGRGIIGIPQPKAWFIAHSTKDDISARDDKDYQIKYMRVYEDFIKPLLKNA
jgi:hypothetical protein